MPVRNFCYIGILCLKNNLNGETDMKYYTTSDKEFAEYGRVIDIDASEIIKAAKTIEMPSEGSCYEVATAKFENLDICEYFKSEIFGELPIQVGYCWGHSTKLNALEWHKNSEINVAVTDLVLFLGRLPEMEEDNRYNSENIKAFYIKAGEVIEVYATTLHFCPCEVSEEGFGCVVVLPEGTNVPLDGEPEDKLLFRKNKWLIAHEDNEALKARGAAAGIYGENLDVGDVLN